MSGPVRIVRKVDPGSGETLALWINGNGDLMGWWEYEGASTADEEIARYPEYAGWTLVESNARRFGTTLSALHQELTGGGEG